MEVLEKASLLSLGTTGNDGPWVADVVFLHDDDLNIYWISSPKTRHSQNILENGKAAGSITYLAESKAANFGIQFEGKAEKLDGINFDLLIKYLKKKGSKLPSPSQASEMLNNRSWYKITPSKIFLIDEENFGFKRQEVELSLWQSATITI